MEYPEGEDLASLPPADRPVRITDFGLAGRAWGFLVCYVGLAEYACSLALAGRPVVNGAFLDD